VAGTKHSRKFVDSNRCFSQARNGKPVLNLQPDLFYNSVRSYIKAEKGADSFMGNKGKLPIPPRIAVLRWIRTETDEQ
jgi:hypothetical protein